MKKISVPTGAIGLTGGIVGHRDRLNTENLMKAIDPHMFASIFAEEHESWYAEPEFAGQYVDALVQHYRRSGEQDFLDRAKIVVDSIVKHQRADGYLGTYRAGLEFEETFGVWNQAFVIKGLVSYYEATGDERALEAATKCADFNATAFLAADGPELLRSVNQSIQHTTILPQIVRLYRITKKELYLEFANFIVRRWEETTIKFVTAPNEWFSPLLEMGALKAIESFVCYQGILELYEATGVEKYLSAAERYWELVKREQINIVGCGAICEIWVIGGGRPANLPIDVHPNETCVAWGWGRLSMMLFQLTGKARYLDAIEQTLYNHILGAQAADGSDFSYYQGLIGRKVHAKKPGEYSCCRYRGLHFLSYFPDYVVAHDEETLFVNFYTPASARLDELGASVTIETDYPKTGAVRIVLEVDADRDIDLKLRIPHWCASHEVAVDSEASAGAEDGWITISRRWTAGEHTIELNLEMTVRVQKANVDHRDSVGITYGPLALAIDSVYRTPIHTTEIELTGEKVNLEPTKVGSSEDLPIVAFRTKGTIDGKVEPVTLVDYASAGSTTPNRDEFKVWLPIAGS